MTDNFQAIDDEYLDQHPTFYSYHKRRDYLRNGILKISRYDLVSFGARSLLDKDVEAIKQCFNAQEEFVSFVQRAPRYVLEFSPQEIKNLIGNHENNAKVEIIKSIISVAVAKYGKKTNLDLLFCLLEVCPEDQRFKVFELMISLVPALLQGLNIKLIAQMVALFPSNAGSPLNKNRYEIETYFLIQHPHYARSFIQNNTKDNAHIIQSVLKPQEKKAEYAEHLWRRLYKDNKNALLNFVREKINVDNEGEKPYFLAKSDLIRKPDLFRALCEGKGSAFKPDHFLALLNNHSHPERLIVSHHEYLKQRGIVDTRHMFGIGIGRVSPEKLLTDDPTLSIKLYLLAYYHPNRLLLSQCITKDPIKARVLSGEQDELLAYTLIKNPLLLKQLFPKGHISSEHLTNLLKLTKNPTALIVVLANEVFGQARSNFILRAIGCAVKNGQYSNEHQLHSVLTQTYVGTWLEGKVSLFEELHGAVDAANTSLAHQVWDAPKTNSTRQAIETCIMNPVARRATKLTPKQLAKIFSHPTLDQRCHFSLAQDVQAYNDVMKKYISAVVKDNPQSPNVAKSWSHLSLIFAKFKGLGVTPVSVADCLASKKKYNTAEEKLRNKLFRDIPEIAQEYQQRLADGKVTRVLENSSVVSTSSRTSSTDFSSPASSQRSSLSSSGEGGEQGTVAPLQTSAVAGRQLLLSSISSKQVALKPLAQSTPVGQELGNNSSALTIHGFLFNTSMLERASSSDDSHDSENPGVWGTSPKKPTTQMDLKKRDDQNTSQQQTYTPVLFSKKTVNKQIDQEALKQIKGRRDAIEGFDNGEGNNNNNNN